MIPDWVPGVGIAIAASGLTMWRSQAVTDTKVAALGKELADVRHSHDKDIAALRHDMEAFMKSHGVDLRDACKELREVAANFRAMSAEQAVINTVSTKALEGIVTKLDAHHTAITQHSASLELIRELMGTK